MTKRLSEKEKEEISIRFTKGENIEFLSEEFNCTKLTISRNLKKILGELEYKNLINKSKIKNATQTIKDKESRANVEAQPNANTDDNLSSRNKEQKNLFANESFFEIPPLNLDIDNVPQKELSSKHISEVSLPRIVYMVVENKIELEIKRLKDYPDWHFLPVEDLNRKTIEIYNDLKTAKRFCRKEQKVIKVPNSSVFEKVAPTLLSRGISRIINAEQLIAL